MGNAVAKRGGRLHEGDNIRIEGEETANDRPESEYELMPRIVSGLFLILASYCGVRPAWSRVRGSSRRATSLNQ